MSDLNTIRPCCMSVQLNTLFTSFDHTLRTLGTSVSKEIPTEPEITLSLLTDWLVWEVPNTTMTATLRTLTQPYVDTIISLMNRDNVSVGRVRTKALTRLTLTLPKPKRGDEVSLHIKHLRSLFGSRISTHYVESVDPDHETITLTSDQPRRLRPILITVTGQLDQLVSPRMHLVTFQVSKL